MLRFGSLLTPSAQEAILSANSIKGGRIRHSSFDSKLSLVKCIERSLTRHEVYVTLRFATKRD